MPGVNPNAIIDPAPSFNLSNRGVNPMKRQSTFLLFVTMAFAAFALSSSMAVAQKKPLPDPNRIPPLVRTTTRHETLRLGYGGTLTLVGAPVGSIRIEGWARNEIDITAEIQIRADTEADLIRLGAINNFILDDDSNHVRIMTMGTHDKAFMRTVDKKFPKELLGLPWKIDYRIRVPVAIDVNINAGRGPITVAGIEGDVRIIAAESETNLNLAGGSLSATVAIGKVNLIVPGRSWRRGGVDLRIASGEIGLELPPGFSADIDGEILRAGQINDSFGGLTAREKPGLTPQRIRARAGAGGAFIQLTVGDGTINIKKSASSGQ